MGILEILGIVVGSGGIGSFVTWLVQLKAEKRLKEAEAAQSESTAESMNIANKKDKFEAMYVQITKMMHDYNELSDDYRAYRQVATVKERNFQKKVDDKCQELAALKSQIQYLKGLRCYDTTCPNRIKTNPEK
jgi:uncharacterized membrane protein YcjF (UPF0283 family)